MAHSMGYTVRQQVFKAKIWVTPTTQSGQRRLVEVQITAPTLSEARMLAQAQYGADRVQAVY